MYKNIDEAIRANDVKAVQAFIEKGADLSDFDNFLNLAAELNFDEICELLLSYEKIDSSQREETKISLDVDINELKVTSRQEYHVNELLQTKKMNEEPIAIIGMGLRFPGMGADISGFSQMLLEGKDATTLIPSDRWKIEQYYSEVKGELGKSYTKAGAFIQQDIKAFDAGFFNISPTEAKYLDPQQRLLMEVIWEALETANVPPSSLNGSDTAVYVGISTQDYGALIGELDIKEAGTAYTATGNSFSTAAGRIAYWLGCEGPTMSIDTACSSSLVALHQACQSIRCGESKMAVVGGISLMLSPSNFINFSQASMLSVDGKCKAFDASADGYGRGEGCGVVIVKSLTQALNDNDSILAVIRGSAVNQDGRSSGLTVPNGPAQERLIRSALKQANLDPNDIDYIEAHGTGTSLGDPIELNALKAVFSTDNPRKEALVVGTAKTYIGHLEAAAGLAGLIKTVLSLRDNHIPELLHFKHLNPNIDLSGGDLKLAIEPQEWPIRENHVRRAGISSFGFSGTNVHVIIEEAPENKREYTSVNDNTPQLFVISAKKQEALKELIEKYVAYLGDTEDTLSDIAYTSAIGRNHFAHRIAVIACTKNELIQKLRREEIPLEKNIYGELQVLAERYVAGGMIDWQNHYAQQGNNYRKVCLPTYAFQRQRYWVTADSVNVPVYDGMRWKKTTNPFLDGPFSVGNGEQIFVHTLTETEVSELAGHIIFGTPIMPGPGYMGLMLMACQAFQEKDVIECYDVEIIAPMVIQSGVSYQIVLRPMDDTIHVSFYGNQGLESGWQCHAKALFKKSEPYLALAEQQISLQSLLDECPWEIHKKDFYSGLEARGYQYAVDFQGVELFYYGKEALLAKIELHSHHNETSFHPVALDICLHATLGGLLVKETTLDEAYLPIGVENIQVYRALPKICYVSSRSINQEVDKSYARADMTLYDEQGNLVARFVGLATKKTTSSNLRNIIAQLTKKQSAPEQTLTYVPQWEKLPFINFVDEENSSSVTWMIILENSAQRPLLQERLTKHFSSVYYVCLDELNEVTKEESIGFIASSNFLSVLYFCDASIEKENTSSPYQSSLKRSHQLLYWSQQLSTLLQHTESRFWVVTTQVNVIMDSQLPMNLTQSVVKGFLRSLILERPQADIKHIDIEATLDQSLNQLIHEMCYPNERSEHSELTYRDAQSWIECLIPKKNVDTELTKPFIIYPHKTYLITGGLGGIGWHLCQWLLDKGARNIALLGRREIDEEKEAQRMQWLAENKQVNYYRCDIALENDVNRVLDTLVETMPVVTGVFHTAGVASINSLIKQQPEDFTLGFESKVQGTWLLYHALSLRYAEQLEFMLLFSSITSSLGSPGMLSYAASNAFMDSFAQSIKQENKKHGHVLSINWGPWAEIGMVTYMQQPKRSSGLGLIPLLPSQAFSLLETVCFDPSLCAVSFVNMDWEEASRFAPKSVRRVKGISSLLSNSHKKTVSQRPMDFSWVREMAEKTEQERQASILMTLKQLIIIVTGMAESDLSESMGFVEMGMDSLMSIDLKNRLQALLGDTITLSNTVIFDYPSLDRLSVYLSEQIGLSFGDKQKKVFIPQQREKYQPSEAIAVVGLGVRMPNKKSGEGNDLASFWELFSEGEEAVGPMPAERWNSSEFYSEDKNASGKMYVNQAAFLSSSPDQFDAAFFNISPVEANYLDPQQRLLLECTWEALENAGILPEQLRGQPVGVYVGISSQDYGEMLSKLPDQAGSSAYTATGNALSTAAGRIAFWLGCEGLTMSIDTACSSSLVALHQAANSIRTGENSMAIVAGVNLMLSPSIFISFSRAHMLSADGRCKTFDANADGYGRGEGCGVVILKSLTQACADKDNILAVIRGSAVNQDGRSSGLTVPNGPAQERLIRSALQQAHLNPNDIDYIEAHGTGTSLGDPIELNALKTVFSTDEPRERPLVIGTAKTHVGHLEAAAGMAGLIKTILSLQHHCIPKLLHFNQLNPNIDLSGGKLELAIEPQKWPVNKQRVRRAGISSFGFSGTNAHVILEEAPENNRPYTLTEENSPHLFVFSGKQASAREELKEKYLGYLSETNEALSDIAYTSAIGRSHFAYRGAVIACTKDELVAKLKNGEILYSHSNTSVEKSIYHELQIVAERYIAGDTIDWQAHYMQQGSDHWKVCLPTYAFQRQRYWMAAHQVNAPIYDGLQLKKTSNPFLDGPFAVANGDQVYVHTLTESEVSELAGHVIFGTPIMPGPGYMGLMLMACQLYQKKDNIECGNIEIIAPMVIQTGAAYQIVFHPVDTNIHVSFYGRQDSESDWQCHAKMMFKMNELHVENLEKISLQSLLDECSQEIHKKDFYAGLEARGYQYEDNFQGVEAFYYGEDALLAKVELSAHHEETHFHPVALDICLHATLGSLLVYGTALEEAYLPIGVENIQVYRALPRTCYVYSRSPKQMNEKSYARADLVLYDEEGNTVASFSGVISKKTNAVNLQRIIQKSLEKSAEIPSIMTYLPQWEKLPQIDSLSEESISHTPWMIIVENSAQLPLFQERLTKYFSSVHYICLDKLDDAMKAESASFISLSKSLSVLYFCDALTFQENSLSPYEASLKTSHRLLDWSQQLSTVLQEKESRFLVVTTQVNAVVGTNLLVNLAQSVVKGFMRSLILERPEADIKHIDIEATSEQSFHLLIHEMLYPTQHTELTYRDQQAWIECLAPKLPENSTEWIVNAKSTYLITGGLGGIGWTLCQWLLDKGACHIALLGRREMDEEKEAQRVQWLAENKQVNYYRCDLALENNVADVVNTLAETMPPIIGVFHTAGVMSVKSLLGQQPEDFTSGFDSKVQGTWLLHQAISSRYADHLEFMLLFSSISSSLGSPGMLSYAASNAFMDSFAQSMHQENKQKSRVLSINWGPWAEVGMVSQFREDRRSRLGFIRLLTKPALDMLEKILSNHELSVVSAIDMDWDEVNRFMPKAMQRVKGIKYKKTTLERSSDAAWLREVSKKTEKERLLFITNTLKQLLMTVAGLSGDILNEDHGFAEMGIDSLMAVDLKNRLQNLLGDSITLSNTIIFDYPSLGQLSSYLSEQVAQSFSVKQKKSTLLPQYKRQREKNQQDDAIAVVGLGMRMPNKKSGEGNDLVSCWKLFAEGEEAVSLVPEERWDNSAFYSEDKDALGKVYVNKAAFLSSQLDQFDAAFFNISPIEANYLDPQQRLLLECTWEALENGGILPEQLRGQPVGVYVGISSQDYGEMLSRLPGDAGTSPYTATGNALSTAAGRIAFWLGCEGSTMSIDTACSSSLVALHQAVNSIRMGENSMAIVAAVNLMLSPSIFINFSRAHMLSMDGRCKTFDADADGYGRGEGCGVVILKSLTQARADNDNILAMIRGSAVNQDGRSSGLTVPNGPAQERLIRSALQQAHLNPNDIDYIEAHGTGTSLGDPIELNALKTVFSTDELRERPLIIGTAKTYVGHLEAAAGMAGLIKTILSLQHSYIPKLLHFKRLNSNIDLSGSKIELAIEPQKWPAHEQRVRRAGISSFGFSGTNAHVILEEAPENHREVTLTEEASPQLFVFSGKQASAREELKEKYLAYLSGAKDALSDIAYTSAIGRSHFTYRGAVIARTVEELKEKLERDEMSRGECRKPVKMTFLFTGQGSQYANMGLGLYETQPIFKDILDDCAELLKEELPCSFYSVLFGDNQSLLNQTQYAQPLLFSVEYALAQLWMHWGIVPYQMIGHSLGEFVAATVAGVMTLPEAIKLVASRARLMQALPENVGSMMAIQASLEDVQFLIKDLNINIAGINAPKQTVVSGSVEKLHQLKYLCEGRKIKSTILSVSHAFHSDHIKPMVEAFRKIALSIHYEVPQIALISTVTGELLHEITAEYWCEQLIRPVNYLKAIQTTLSEEYQMYLEVGPSPVLTALGQQCIERSKMLMWGYSIKPGMSNQETMQITLSQCYTAGFNISWAHYYASQRDRRCKVSLPTYAFQRERYWMCPPEMNVWNSDYRQLKKSADVSSIMTYLPQWEKLPQIDNVSEESTSHVPWMIILENSAQLPLFQEQLTKHFSSVHYVCLDRLNDAMKAESESFIASSKALSVLYFCDALMIQETSTSPYEASLKTSHQLLNWSQQLSTVLQQKESRFFVVTTQVNAVIDAGFPVNLAQSVVKGFMRSLILERPEADIKHIDIEATSEQSVHLLIHEMLHPTQHTELTYRDEQTWIECLVPKLPENSTEWIVNAELTYLITGGLGGIGWSLCQWLLNKGACHIALLGRREMDEEKEAQRVQWLAENKQINYYRCDLALETDVAHAVNELAETMPPITGVFHTAGVMSIKPLSGQQPEDFVFGFDSKVQGTWLLHQAISSRYADHLEFMILFSSISSSLGSPGMLSYAASNAFMDGFAQSIHQENKQKCRVLSINWGPWAEVGMIGQFKKEPLQKERRSHLGFIPMLTIHALDMLEKILSDHKLSVVSAIDMNWSEVNQFTPKAMQRVKGVEYKTVIVERHLDADWLKEAISKPQKERQQFIAGALKKLLVTVGGFSDEALNEDTHFTEMGIDSLMGVALKNRLQDLLGDNVVLSNTVLFDYPSLGQLSEYLAVQITAQEKTMEIMEVIPEKSLPFRFAETQVEKQLETIFKAFLSVEKLGVFDTLELQKITFKQSIKIYQKIEQWLKEKGLEVFDINNILEKENIAAMAIHISCILEINNDIGNDTLFTCVKKNKKELIVSMLSKQTRDINMLGANGKTSLHLAVQLGNVDMAVWLLSQGAHLNRETDLGITPLALALFNQQFDLVEAFLKYLPSIDLSVFSLTSDQHIKQYLSAVVLVRDFIMESMLQWTVPFKENIYQGKPFLQGIEDEHIKQLLLLIPESQLLIEHCVDLNNSKSTAFNEERIQAMKKTGMFSQKPNDVDASVLTNTKPNASNL